MMYLAELFCFLEAKAPPQFCGKAISKNTFVILHLHFVWTKYGVRTECS